MTIKNKVQLITYPDSLGGNLKDLNNLLLTSFQNLFQGGVHILPPYPSSGDRGFAPLSYFEIDPKFGTWEDLKEIGKNFDIILDLMVNHISKESIYFQDFLINGRDSIYSDFFITLDKLWKDGKPIKEDLSKIFLRRQLPYSIFNISKTNDTEAVWTTFGKENPSEQIDLDINSSSVRNLLKSILINFKEKNIKIIRLDAIGYVIKKLGTSCFFIEPEIYDFIDWIKEVCDSLDLEILPEVHSHYNIQFKLANKYNWIYDFILPYLVLNTFINKTNVELIKYLKIRPSNQFTMLDCHDGIPVKPDLDDLVDSQSAKDIVDVCLKRDANLSLIYSDNHKSKDGFDVHQIRGTYYSLLNCDDDAYISARAIQFFIPGIPQVYYVGLLAGENDQVNVKLTNEGREINRHNFTIDEINESLEKSVVQRLIKLIKFRNSYPAFDGNFNIIDSNEKEIILNWEKENKHCTLNVNLETNKGIIEYVSDNSTLLKYYI